MTRTERERGQRQNRIPVRAHNWWKKLLHKFTDALFQVDAYFKKWFNRFFLYAGMKLEFLFSTGIK